MAERCRRAGRRASPRARRRGGAPPRQLGHGRPGAVAALETLGSAKTLCVGKISSPGSSVETSTASICALAGVLRGEGDGGLVAVVAVGDQQLLVVERADEARIVEPPQLRALDLEVGVAVGATGGCRPVVEEEDRLQLDARRPQQPQAPLLRAGVRALVRQHRAGLVGLDLERADDPEARARDPVRADVLLLQGPHGRRLLDDLVGAPGPELAGGLLLRVRSVSRTTL